MTLKIGSRKKVLFYSICLLLTWLLVFILTSQCPYLCDDWHFFFVFEAFDPLEHNQRVGSFADILTSMKNYYHFSGGRVIAHFLVYCLLTMNKVVFNVLNGVMYAAMCWLLFRIVQAISASKSIWLLPLTIMMSFCFTPVLGDNALWLSGSVNYLWMSVPFLCCINWLIRRFDQAAVWERLCILPLFLLSGATNEVTGGILAVTVVLCFFLSKRRSIFALIGCLVALVPGICLVILAPGNSFRREVFSLAQPSAVNFLVTLIGFLLYLVQHTGVLLVPVFLYFFLSNYDKKLSWKERLRPLTFFLIGIAGVFGLSLACFLNPRPLFFTFVLLLPAALSACVSIYRLFQKPEIDLASLLQHGICICILAIGVLCAVHKKTAVFSIICMLLAFVLLKVRAEKLLSFSLKLRKLLKLLIPAVSLLLCGVLISRIYTYSQWSQQIKQYEREQIDYIFHDQLMEAVENQYIPEKLCNLIPYECSAGKPWFYVEWMAEYYGKDSKPVVEAFSDTYKPFLEYLAGKFE